MDNLKKTVQSFRKELIYIALVLIVIGILLVAFPQSSATIICYIIGAALCVWGIWRIANYFRIEREFAFGTFGLVRGGALLLLGILCLIRPEVIASFLMIVFGIVLFVDGVLKIQYAIDMLRLKAPGWWMVLVGALLMVALGIVALCNPFTTAVALVIFVGISLIVDGAADLATIIYFTTFVKQAKRMVEQVATDAKDAAAARDAEFRPLDGDENK